MIEISVLLNIYPGDDISLLEDCLQSICIQTVKPNLLMVVSDGPPDLAQIELVDKVKCNCDFEVFIYSISHRLGLWNARNIGLQLLKTKYVALMDADDVMHPQRLEYQIGYLQRNDVDVLGASIFEIDSESKLILGARSAESNESKISQALQRNNVIFHPTVVVKRESVLAAGGYRNYYLSEDYELWLRMLSLGYRIDALPEALLGFHVNDQLFMRRGGIRFLKSELDLFAAKRNYTNASNSSLLLNLVARLTYRNLPWRIRRYVHKQLFYSRKIDTKIVTETDFLNSEPVRL